MSHRQMQRRPPVAGDTKAGPQSSAVGSGPPAQVLVVDDEVVVRRVVSDYLEGMGYVVASVESGEEAIAYVLENRPAVVLLDIFMPGMNGLDILRTLKRERPRTQILVISGFADEELERKVKGLGAAECLRKPFDFSRLSELVATGVGAK